MGVTEEVVDARDEVYGVPLVIYTRVAHLWSAILDHEIQPCEVPLLMMGLKLIRTQQCPTYSDNSDDIEGYLKIFRDIVGGDMVQARTVAEYIEKRR